MEKIIIEKTFQKCRVNGTRNDVALYRAKPDNGFGFLKCSFYKGVCQYFGNISCNLPNGIQYLTICIDTFIAL